jgi:transcriptional regulator with XRE-family HTH domain
MAEKFKDRLRLWRGNLRQKEAAEKLGVPYATYRKWEIGKRTPGKLTAAELERRMAV